MSSVGQQLRAAREEQNLSLEKIEELTKIKIDHLRSLEEGRFEAFSAPIYVRGFVRNYAATLKLNIPKILSALDEELGQTKKFQEPISLSGTRTGFVDFLMLQFSKLDWRVGVALLVLVVAGAVLFGAYRAWVHYRNYDPLVKLGPGLYEPRRTNAGETLPLPNP